MTGFYDFSWPFIIWTDYAKNPLQGISQQPEFGTQVFHENRTHDNIFTVANVVEVEWVCVVQGRKLTGYCEQGYEHSCSRRRETSLP